MYAADKPASNHTVFNAKAWLSTTIAKSRVMKRKSRQHNVVKITHYSPYSFACITHTEYYLNRMNGEVD